MDDSGKLVRQRSEEYTGSVTGWSTTLLLMTIVTSLDTTAAPSIKCWNNNQNGRECGSVVPPEFSQKRIEVINDQGVVIDIIPAAKTKKQLAEEKKQKQRDLEKKRRKKYDTILLKSFTTERDLVISRENNLDAITGIINVSRGNALTLKKNLNNLQKKAGDYERSGKQVPDKLIKDIDDIKRQQSEIDVYIKMKEKERTKMVKRFEDDLKRFRKLKKVKPH